MREKERLEGIPFDVATSVHGEVTTSPETKERCVLMRLDASFAEVERAFLSAVLEDVGRNITGAARRLGTSRRSVQRLMDKHGIARWHHVRAAETTSKENG